MNNINRNSFRTTSVPCTQKIRPSKTSTRQSPLLRTAATGLLLTASYNVNALTLNDAVNAQLATVTLPCDRLLGADPATVLTGGLLTLCGRTVPFGSTPQSTGGGAANLSSLSSTAMTVMQEGQAHEEMQIGAKWTLFVTAENETLNRDVTNIEDGFDSDAVRLIAGGTYVLNPKTDLGFALNTQRHEGDYTNGGNFKTTTTGIRLMGSMHISDQLFLQTLAGYDSVSSQRTRAATFDERFNGGLVFLRQGTPSSDFDYTQTELSVLAGYNYMKGSFTLTPQLGLTWLDINYGTFREAGSSGLELTFHDDKRQSLQSAVGLQTTMAISTGFGVVIPQLDLRWKHEFADDARQVNVSFTQDSRAKQFSYDTEAGDRNYFELGAGIGFVFSQGKQAFVRIQTLLSHDYYDNYLVTAGLNIEL